MSYTQESQSSQQTVENQGYKEIKEEEEPSTSGMSGDRPQKRSGRRPGRRSSKMDVRAKLERSRQSARECRARKKLRYQYLEDLVANREKAVFALRDELEIYKQWCIQLDQGITPKELLKLSKELESCRVTETIPECATELENTEEPMDCASDSPSSHKLYINNMPQIVTQHQWQSWKKSNMAKGGNSKSDMVKEGSSKTSLLKGGNSENDMVKGVNSEIDLRVRDAEWSDVDESDSDNGARPGSSDKDVTWDFVFEGDILKVVPKRKTVNRTMVPKGENWNLPPILEENQN